MTSFSNLISLTLRTVQNSQQNVGSVKDVESGVSQIGGLCEDFYHDLLRLLLQISDPCSLPHSTMERRAQLGGKISRSYRGMKRKVGL